jgi:Protein of unknown function (DUF1549)/Protein of unknown function (DUF1553)
VYTKPSPPPPPRTGVTPPPLPVPVAPQSLARVWVAPAACLLLAAVSVAAGAFVLPRLGPKPAALEPKPIAVRLTSGDSAESPTVTPPQAEPVPTTPSAPLISRFDVPAITPRLPSAAGPYAISRMIDRDVDARLGRGNVPASPLAGDAEFLRRVHLDLIGKIPTRERAAAFLSDADPTKRSKLIDELLARPEFGQHFARLWADALIKRDFDNNKSLSPAAFTAWLAERFEKNVGWDRIVRDMVTANGLESNPETFFILAHQDNRQVSPSKLVGTVGNLFMGIQIQCAECHKHPFHEKWGQDDFWGMAAFFGHTRAQRAGPAKGAKQVGPATITEAEQQGAAVKKGAKNKPAVRPGLVIAIPDPNDPRKVVRSVRGKFFESNKAPPAGKAPYRPAFADWLTSSNNAYFAPAAVNRLWAHFFSRGLVHPVEEMSDKNPATHPELLRSLAGVFAASRFDVKDFVRGVCNSRAYQRTSRPISANAADDKLFSHMPVKVLDAKQLIDSLAVATGKAMPPGRAAPARRGMRDAGDPLLRYLDTREYGDDPTEFTYGIPQLLRLMNTQLTASSAEKARELVGKGADAERILDDIYLTALARKPSDAERSRMAAYVLEQSDPRKGYAGVLWALLNCAEFISNR